MGNVTDLLVGTTQSSNTLANTGQNIGEYAGIGGVKFSYYMGKFSSFIANTSLVEWLVLVFIFLGMILVVYMKRRFNLTFKLWPKKPKKTFN